MYSARLNELSDLDLVSHYKETGDNSFVGALFQRYTRLAFAVCMKYLRDEEESKDAVMQVFEKLLSDLKKHEVTNFKSWLHSVVKNHCLMQLRSQQSQLTREQEMKKDMKAVMESTYDLHLLNGDEKEIQLNSLQAGIEQLNEGQKICIELFYLKEKCYQEIADITGFTLNQVKSHIQNGKRNLKIYLTANNEQQTG
jgi:RNA polymerase sigma factor (sigma-70 family)